MKLLMICQWAVTSKGMVSKIVQLAQGGNDGIEVECESVAAIKEIDFSRYDVVLLAPQVRNYMASVTEKCSVCQVPVASIDVVAYGLGDANKVLEQAKKLCQSK